MNNCCSSMNSPAAGADNAPTTQYFLALAYCADYRKSMFYRCMLSNSGESNLICKCKQGIRPVACKRAGHPPAYHGVMRQKIRPNS